MSEQIRVIAYVLFLIAIACMDLDVPVVLWYRRTVFVTEWKMAAFLQRRALNAYGAYVNEVECSHG